MSPAQSVPPEEAKLKELVNAARTMTEEDDFDSDVTARLYGELGNLAKYLNMMLKEIQSAELQKASNQIPLITGQLSDVTRYTEEETHRILEYTEKTMSNHDLMTTSLDSVKAALAGDAPDKAQLTEGVDQVYALAEENKKILMDLLMALSFQDLAGQRMRKIEDLMQEVQSRILKLILALGLKARSHSASKSDTPIQAEATATAPKLEGPASAHGLNQGVVDDILKEFGF